MGRGRGREKLVTLLSLLILRKQTTPTVYTHLYLILIILYTIIKLFNSNFIPLELYAMINYLKESSFESCLRNVQLERRSCHKKNVV